MQFARTSLTSVVALLAAPLITATPVAAFAIDLYSVSGAPHVTSSANEQDVAWRDFGFRIESELFDAEIRTPTCVASGIGAPGRIANGPAACSSLGDGLSTYSSTARRASATFKVPQGFQALPYIDLTVRKWDSAFHDFGESSSGTAADIVMTKPIGPFDAVFSYETPLQRSRTSGRWRTASMGVGWTSSFGLSFQVTADRSRDIDFGDIDRSMTMRFAYRINKAGALISAWSRRNFDDRQLPWRAGLTARFPF
jgi:hypothetical protein